MRFKGAYIDDPATRGYANPPELCLIVEPNRFKEVWQGPDGKQSLTRVNMAPRYFLGQGDQFNQIDGVSLSNLLYEVRLGSENALRNKDVWVLWEYELEFARRESIVLIQFEYYHLREVLSDSRSGGAFGHLIDTPDGTGFRLQGGWSSSASVFNRTGILPAHYMEVNVVTKRQGLEPHQVGALFQAPIHFVSDTVNRIAGRYYEVNQFEERGDRIERIR